MWNVIIIFKDKKIITINYSQDSYINLYNNCDNNNNIKFVKILLLKLLILKHIIKIYL